MNVKHLRLSLLALAVSVVPLWGDSAPAQAQQMREELARLLTTHPQIAAARKQKEAGIDRIDEAFSGFLPRADVVGETGFERAENNVTRAQGEPFSGRRDRLRLSVTQNLFNGFGDSARLQAARHDAAVLDARLTATKQSLLLEGIAAYLNILRESQLIDIARLNERNIQNRLRLEDERVRRGAGITVDVLQAKSRLQIAKERRVAFEGRLRAAEAQYLQIFDRQPDATAMAAAPLLEVAVPANLEDTLALAKANNPTTQAGDFTARANRERRTAAKSEYYPTLDLVGEIEYEGNANGTDGNDETYGVFVRGRWEFFSGFKSRARIRAANRTYEASQRTLDFSHRKVAEEVRLSWESLTTQRHRVTLLENAVRIAQEVLRARRRLRRAGKETALNVLDAEGEVFNAQINFVEALFDSRVAVFRVIRSSGMLNEKTLGLENG
ncbi:MAG: TolC family protein [Alphaproteobacteria bacterium]|nr:TolC family protein [Alphaproteobacteria bacterium]